MLVEVFNIFSSVPSAFCVWLFLVIRNSYAELASFRIRECHSDLL